MVSMVNYLALITSLAVSCFGKVPVGYILQITPTCGESVTQDAVINIITDLNVEAKGVCAGGKEVAFNSDDGVNFDLSVSYPAQGSRACRFEKRTNALVFAITVVVSYGEKGNLLHQNQEEYTVTCTFDPKGLDGSDNQDIIDGLIAPTELQTNMGNDSTSNITLEMVNVQGDSLADIDVNLGRMVMIRAVTSGAEGLRPVSCDAIDGSVRYAILRAGCGDGIVFPKTAGFVTAGNSTTSPYFTAFSINTATVVSFECHFLTCSLGSCDGSSCG